MYKTQHSGSYILPEDTAYSIFNVTIVTNSSNDSSSLSGGNGTQSFGTCDDWRDAQHVLFQLSSLCFIVAFLIPAKFKFHALCLRVMVTLGALFMVLWGGTVVCHPDVVGWYSAFLLVNAGYLVSVIYAMYPVQLHPETEDLYVKQFHPFKVSRYQFRELCNTGQIKDLIAGATYANEGATHAGEKVSLLLSGRLKVTYSGIFLHHIEPNQFLDSPEYEAVLPSSDEEEVFQVSVTATEDSRLLTWSCHELHTFLTSRPFLSAVFTNLLGKDITIKLYQIYKLAHMLSEEEMKLYSSVAKVTSEVQELLVSRPEKLPPLPSQNSVSRARQRLSQSMSNNNLVSMTKGFSDMGNSFTLTWTESKESVSKSRVPTPTGPYSPSQVSFETCV